MARIVLVHGAFAGAWCWERVVGPLEAAGHTVETLDLPGGGDDETPMPGVTLENCAGRVCSVLASRPEPAVLVGHSMGGAIITQAAGNCPEHVASLIYVCAFMPRNGQSLLDLTQLPEGADDQIQANLVVSGDPPVATLSAEAWKEAVFNCCTEDQADWGVARRRGQAVAPFATPVSIDDDALGPIPRSYVLCTRDQSIPPALQRRMVSEHPCRKVIEIDTDHAPWASRVDELVAALDELARQP
jgi:pimeloyl-ACP methyl ester carboxylesterase